MPRPDGVAAAAARSFRAEQMAKVCTLLRLRLRLSAEQVSGALKKTGALCISTETIDRRIRWDKRTGGDLWKSTQIMSKFGRKRSGRHDSRGVLQGKRYISEHPPEVEQRLSIGPWEGDTVMGCDLRHCVLTLVERKTGFAIIKKLETRSAAEVTRAATVATQDHCSRFETLTFDNGTEFHAYAKLEERFPTMKIYFATPYHSRERVSNENFNGLVRQYIPKGTCMSSVTQARCDKYMDELNKRPRKRLGFNTPGSLYYRS